MNFFAIDEKLANQIITYLGNRPMIEVEAMVIGLRQVKPIQIEEPKEKTTETE